jgi:hypothetical protein
MIGPRQLRLMFSETQSGVPRLIVGAPEAEFLPGESAWLNSCRGAALKTHRFFRNRKGSSGSNLMG